MMNKINLIILFVLLFVIDQTINCQFIYDENVGHELIECNEQSRNKLDESLMRMSTFADPNREYPSTRDQMNVYCR